MKERLVIVWRVYEPCNLGCHFCGYSREIPRKRHVTDPDVILRFGKTLSDFQQRTGTDVLVSWLGGEPLLWKELPSLAETYHREYGLTLGVTTNGSLLDRKAIRESLIEHYSLLTISIDSFAEFHDLHRSEQGLFDKIERHIPLLLDEIHNAGSPLVIRINTILMRENIHQFESFCMEMAKWGVGELTFNQLGGIDRPEFYPDHRLLPEQAERFADELPRIQQNALSQGLRIFGAKPYLERIIATSRDIPISIDDCNPGTRFLFIDEANRVSPCNFTSQEYGLPLSELKTADDLLQLPARFRHKQIHERAAPCDNCHSTQVFAKFNQTEPLVV